MASSSAMTNTPMGVSDFVMSKNSPYTSDELNGAKILATLKHDGRPNLQAYRLRTIEEFYADVIYTRTGQDYRDNPEVLVANTSPSTQLKRVRSTDTSVQALHAKRIWSPPLNRELSDDSDSEAPLATRTGIPPLKRGRSDDGDSEAPTAPRTRSPRFKRERSDDSDLQAPPAKRTRNTKKQNQEPKKPRGGKKRRGQEVLMAHLRAYLDFVTTETQGRTLDEKVNDNFCSFDAADVPDFGNKIGTITKLKRFSDPGQTDFKIIGRNDGKFSQMLGAAHLHSAELDVCETLKMSPDIYLTQKRRCFIALAAIMGAHSRAHTWKRHLGATQLQLLCNADAKNMAIIYRFWMDCGWIDSEKGGNGTRTSDCYYKHFDDEYRDRISAQVVAWEERMSKNQDEGDHPPRIFADCIPVNDRRVEAYYFSKTS